MTAAAMAEVSIEASLRTLAPGIRRVVRAVLGAAHPDVDDVYQQALIAVANALPAFRGECDPIGYARVIAVRSAIAARAQARALRRRHQDGVEPDVLATSLASPAERTAAMERCELVRELLTTLPSEQAETLGLRVLLELSLEEVARETNVPVNTVRSRLRLAKERLRQRLAADAAVAVEIRA